MFLQPMVILVMGNSMFQWCRCSFWAFLLVGVALGTLIPAVAQAEGENDPLWRRPTMDKKVYEIGQRLLQTNGITTHIFFLVDNDQNVNAYVTRWPGRQHQVVIFKGLTDYIASDDELAAVLAHEIAHIVEKHNYKISAQKIGTYTLTTAAASLAALSGDPTTVAATSNLMKKSGNHFSQQYEREADQLAVHYLVKAGYNPLAMETMVNKLSGDAGPLTRFFATHPVGDGRLMGIRQEIETYFRSLLLRPLRPIHLGLCFSFNMTKTRISKPQANLKRKNGFPQML